ncbi:hypothetical protein A2U01_0093284, partial [Trifolium medium]|nr:hypothetical protein [Trifolium medium]
MLINGIGSTPGAIYTPLMQRSQIQNPFGTKEDHHQTKSTLIK